MWNSAGRSAISYALHKLVRKKPQFKESCKTASLELVKSSIEKTIHKWEKRQKVLWSDEIKFEVSSLHGKCFVWWKTLDTHTPSTLLVIHGGDSVKLWEFFSFKGTLVTDDE